jgi:hypothetical protein
VPVCLVTLQARITRELSNMWVNGAIMTINGALAAAAAFLVGAAVHSLLGSRVQCIVT